MDKYIGKKYGKLIVVSFSHRDKWNNKHYNCICECSVAKSFNIFRIKNGYTKSCGCLQKETAFKLKITHGKCDDKLYRTYHNMKNRCFNKKNSRYESYGGRGISVCDEWENDFMSFYSWAIKSGYSEELAIDRINNDGDYEPKNCRWATAETQAINQRIRNTNKSGAKGVFFHNTTCKYKASITFKYKTKWLGYFNTINEAIEARNKYIIDKGLPHKIQEYIND